MFQKLDEKILELSELYHEECAKGNKSHKECNRDFHYLNALLDAKTLVILGITEDRENENRN